MHGLYLLWWVQEKQLPPALVAATLAAGDLAVMAFELPTGWLADRYGHRRSLIAGSCVQIAGMLWCWLGEGVAGLLTASVLVAIGDALRSGADQALLYRSCAALGREHDFQRIEARTGAVELCGLVVLTAGGGLIVTTWGFAAGWVAETLLCAIGLAIACAMAEPPSSAGDDDVSIAGWWHGLLSTRMLALVTPAALIGGAAGATSFMAQTSGGLGPAGTSMLVAGIALAEAGGSAAAAGIVARGAAQQLMFAAGAAAVFAVGAVVPSALTATAITLAFLLGTAGPLRAAAIQRLAADAARARAASLAHACDMAISTLTLPLAGWWTGRHRTGRPL